MAGVASTSKRSARRCLFGPVDREKTSAWLDEQLTIYMEKKKAQWGFDFENETSSGNSEYEYAAIDAATVPAFYRLKTIEPRPYLTASPEEENRMPVVSEDSDESMSAMDTSSEQPIQTPKRRPLATPNKRHQSKLTTFFTPRKMKSLRRSPKTLDLVSPRKSPSGSPASKRSSVGSR